MPFVDQLNKALQESKPLIQIVLGPRQVGKTTGILQLSKQATDPRYAYYSADGDIARPQDWLLERWYAVKSDKEKEVLIIDEIQNIENWSPLVKKLWDEQRLEKRFLKLVLLGSSSLDIQKGLEESLAGRFQVHNVFHWSFQESNKAYGISFDEYLLYGGYPGAYRFIKDREKWLSYMKNSIVDAVIGKDILNQVRVRSPALFRQAYDIAMLYACQEISYTKLLGQLQDKGNTDLVKYYLNHYEGAFLLRSLFKYSKKHHLKRSSSPKILPMCPALYSINLDADLNQEELGRSFESIVGAALCRLPGRLYYWRERNQEVDFIYQEGKKLVAIEVKYNSRKESKGLGAFKNKYPSAKILLINKDNFLDMEALLADY